MSSSNITPRGAPSATTKPSFIGVEPGAFQTSSPARRKGGSSPLRLSGKMVKSPQTKRPSLNQSSIMGVSRLSQSRLMMSLINLKRLIKFKFISAILKWRNPVPTILVHPDPRLKRIAEPVDFNKVSINERVSIVRKLGTALSKQEYGMKLGIAAPQIGINLRVMVVRGNVMFNPEWQPTKAPSITDYEGCYSIPKDKVYKVERAPYGWASWTTIDGKQVKDQKLNGLPAIVFQHELDHLNGKCCADIGELLELKDK